MDILKIQKAFKPSIEIQDPQFFSGRLEEIREGIIALSEDGSFIVVHGLRGVGKSSIANQIRLIATGSKALSERLKYKQISKLLPKNGFDFITLYHQCDFDTHDTKDLVKRLLLGDNYNSSLLSYTHTGDRRIEKIIETYKANASAKLFGVNIGGARETKGESRTSLSDEIIHQFKQILSIIRKDNSKKQGILFIIDEFDTLRDKAGFASLVKTCSSEFVKFMIVGIASSVSELIREHASIGRQLRSIEVKKMHDEELWGIITNAERFLGKEIEFEDSAAQTIVNKSEGFPYFVHLLGKEAMIYTYENKHVNEANYPKIDENTMNVIFQNISNGKLNTTYESTYIELVKDSPDMEILLKWFAEQTESIIDSEIVYSITRDFGVSNPSELMQKLNSFENEHQGVLTKISEKHYRFTDPVFKVYVKMRSWKH